MLRRRYLYPLVVKLRQCALKSDVNVKSLRGNFKTKVPFLVWIHRFKGFHQELLQGDNRKNTMTLNFAKPPFAIKASPQQIVKVMRFVRIFPTLFESSNHADLP
jgi:hypothetical protein